MIEFALIWAFLFPVLSGVGQFGSGFYQYNNLCSAVRNATRFASVQVYASTTTAVPNDFRDAVRNVVRYGDPQPATGAPLVVDVPPGDIEVQVLFEHNVPAIVAVKVATFEIKTAFKTFTITNKPDSRFPYVGRWDPVN